MPVWSPAESSSSTCPGSCETSSSRPWPTNPTSRSSTGGSAARSGQTVESSRGRLRDRRPRTTTSPRSRGCSTSGPGSACWRSPATGGSRSSTSCARRRTPLGEVSPRDDRRGDPERALRNELRREHDARSTHLPGRLRRGDPERRPDDHAGQHLRHGVRRLHRRAAHEPGAADLQHGRLRARVRRPLPGRRPRSRRPALLPERRRARRGSSASRPVRRRPGSRSAPAPAGGAQNVLDVEAASEGAWGNSVRLDVDYDTANPASLFNLTVTEFAEENGVLTPVRTEMHRNLTMNSLAPNDGAGDRERRLRARSGSSATRPRPGLLGSTRGTSRSGDLTGTDFTQVERRPPPARDHGRRRRPVRVRPLRRGRLDHRRERGRADRNVASRDPDAACVRSSRPTRPSRASPRRATASRSWPRRARTGETSSVRFTNASLRNAAVPPRARAAERRARDRRGRGDAARADGHRRRVARRRRTSARSRRTPPWT